MDHPRIQQFREKLPNLQTSPVSKQVILTLQHFNTTLPLLQIKTYIKNNQDFMRLLQNESEKLIHHHFLILFNNILHLPLKTEGKLSLLKVISASAIEAKIDISIQNYSAIVTQICSIILSSSTFDYTIVVKYIITKAKQIYGYSFNLLELPKLIQVLKKLPSQYQICMIELLLNLVTSSDQLVSSINRIVIQNNLYWVSKTLYNVLHCSRLMLESIENESECIDPYNMYIIWCQLYDSVDNPSEKRQSIFKMGMDEIKLWEIVSLYKHLRYDITLRDIGLLRLREFPIPKSRSVSMISQILSLFAKSCKYFVSFDQTIEFTDDERDKLEPSWTFLDDLFEFIINQKLDPYAHNKNYYWYNVIQEFLTLSSDESKQSNKGFCGFLFDKRIFKQINLILKEETALNLYLSQSILHILTNISLSTPIRLCEQLKSIDFDQFFSSLIESSKLYYSVQFLTTIQSMIYAYSLRKFSSKQNNEGFSNLEIKQTLQTVIIEQKFFKNSSHLFIAASIMSQTLLTTSLLISIFLASDSAQIFENWLKYVNREKLTNQEKSQVQIKQIDQSIVRRLKSWMVFYDSNGKARSKLEKTFRMKYCQLRLMVVGMAEIFSPQ